MITEVGIKISHIKFDRGDLSIYDENNNVIHIVGDNDWYTLMTNAFPKI